VGTLGGNSWDIAEWGIPDQRKAMKTQDKR